MRLHPAPLRLRFQLFDSLLGGRRIVRVLYLETPLCRHESKRAVRIRLAVLVLGAICPDFLYFTQLYVPSVEIVRQCCGIHFFQQTVRQTGKPDVTVRHRTQETRYNNGQSRKNIPEKIPVLLQRSRIATSNIAVVASPKNISPPMKSQKCPRPFLQIIPSAKISPRKHHALAISFW